MIDGFLFLLKQKAGHLPDGFFKDLEPRLPPRPLRMTSPILHGDRNVLHLCTWRDACLIQQESPQRSRISSMYHTIKGSPACPLIFFGGYPGPLSYSKPEDHHQLTTILTSCTFLKLYSKQKYIYVSFLNGKSFVT